MIREFAAPRPGHPPSADVEDGMVVLWFPNLAKVAMDKGTARQLARDIEAAILRAAVASGGHVDGAGPG